MNRRSFLQKLAALPVIGWLLPRTTVAEKTSFSTNFLKKQQFLCWECNQLFASSQIHRVSGTYCICMKCNKHLQEAFAFIEKHECSPIDWEPVK